MLSWRRRSPDPLGGSHPALSLRSLPLSRSSSSAPLSGLSPLCLSLSLLGLLWPSGLLSPSCCCCCFVVGLVLLYPWFGAALVMHFGSSGPGGLHESP